jgi:hypothetical protein
MKAVTEEEPNPDLPLSFPARLDRVLSRAEKGKMIFE